MRIINLPFEGESKMPGTKLGFKYFLKHVYLYKEYYVNSRNFINLECYKDSEILKEAQSLIKKMINNKESIIIFGGNHSTTNFFVEHFLCDKHFPIIVFDAHIDKGEDVSQFYNWNVLSRLNNYISKGLVLGVRHYYSKIENPSKFNIFDDVALFDLNYIGEKIEEFIKNEKTIYVSIDLDVLSPVEFPGVGFKEPGGIFLAQLIFFIRKIRKYNKHIIWDIVEFNPLIEKEKSLQVLERILEEIMFGNQM